MAQFSNVIRYERDIHASHTILAMNEILHALHTILVKNKKELKPKRASALFHNEYRSQSVRYLIF